MRAFVACGSGILQDLQKFCHQVVQIGMASAQKHGKTTGCPTCLQEGIGKGVIAAELHEPCSNLPSKLGCRVGHDCIVDVIVYMCTACSIYCNE